MNTTHRPSNDNQSRCTCTYVWVIWLLHNQLNTTYQPNSYNQSTSMYKIEKRLMKHSSTSAKRNGDLCMCMDLTTFSPSFLTYIVQQMSRFNKSSTQERVLSLLYQAIWGFNEGPPKACSIFMMPSSLRGRRGQRKATYGKLQFSTDNLVIVQ